MKEVIFNGGLASIALLYFSFIVGHYLCKWLKADRYVFKSIIYGFILILATFQVLAIICINFKTKFSVLYYIYTLIVLAIAIVATIFFIKNKEYRHYKKTFNLKKLLKPSLMIAIILIAFQCFLSSYLSHTDADDGYFISISNIAIEQDTIEYNGDIVYNGDVLPTEDSRTDSFSWELFIATISKTFDIHPAVLCHSVLPILLILMCYMVFYDLGRNLLQDEKKQGVFLLIIALLNLFGGYAVFSTGAFLLLRIWQGKAMLANFMIPMVLNNCITLFRKEKLYEWRIFIANVVIVVAGMATTAVGLYLMPITYLCVGLTLIINKLLNRQPTKVLGIIAKAVITLLPVLIYDLYITVKLMSSSSGVSYMSATPKSFLEVFKQTMMNGYVFWIFLACIVFLLIKARKESGFRILVILSLVIFVTFLNPLLSSFVSQKITGVDVYWRLYWIVPIYITIAYTCAFIISKKLQANIAIVVAFAVAIGFSGKFMYKAGLYFESHGNKYKIPEAVKSVCDEIIGEEDVTCIFPIEMSYYPRQYSSKVNVICSRGYHTHIGNIATSDEHYADYYNKLYVEKDFDSDEAVDIIKSFNVVYVYSTTPITSINLSLEKELLGGWLYRCI
ncbi:MAG: hypothetical protein E7189_01870 [Erysipelotrichaceae bacterium]|nr:hypothetical protein [Erysipelotrichaceae bacterium]